MSTKAVIDEDEYDDVSDVSVEVDSCCEPDDEIEGDEEREEEENAEEEEDDPNRVYLECVEGNSSKFYELIINETDVTTRYGRIGTDGTSATKSFKTEDAAQAFFDKTLAEKLKKGYEQVRGGGGGKRGGSDDEEEEDEEEEVKPAKKKPTATKKSSKQEDDEDDAMDVDEINAVLASDPNHAYLECTEGSSFKFYELAISGTSVSTTYGRIGAGGSTATKDYGTVAKARDFYDKTLNEKLRKGYHYAQQRDIPSIRPPVPAPVRATKVEESPMKTKAATTKRNFAYLVCQEGTSNKFYEIILDAAKCGVYIRYGRIGTTGMETNKDFDCLEEAQKFFDKTLQEKLRKGYSHSAADEAIGQDRGLVETKEDEPVKTEAKKGTKRAKAEVVVEEEEEAEEEQQPKKKTATKPAAAVKKETPAAKATTTSNSNSSSNKKDAFFAYMECVDGKSNKFYEIRIDNNTVYSRYGRIGADGQTTLKAFDSRDKAELFFQKTKSEKLLKGYELK